jgi:hypothetical protein
MRVSVGGWLGSYRKVTALPEFSVALQRMPDLYGLAYRSSHVVAVEAILIVVVAACLWLACTRVPLGMAGALACGVGLLLAHHAYGYDCVLLLPLCVMVAEEKRFPIELRLLALVLLSPVLLLLLASPYSLAGQILVAGFVTGMTVFFARSTAAQAGISRHLVLSKNGDIEEQLAR